MHRVSLISQKGGAGKSTLAIHLAAEAAARGKRALLIDLDPQGNALRWAARRGDLPPDVAAESVAALEGVQRDAERDGYDLLVLDTAPNADTTALRAAQMAELVLIPCRPSQFDLEAIRATLDLCALAQRQSRVVLNAAPVRSRVVEDAGEAVRARRAAISPVVIRERVAFRHCMIGGQVARELEPDGLAAQEVSALYDDMMQCLNAEMSAYRYDERTV